MPKTLTFHIHKDEENQSVHQFLREHLGFSKSQIRSLKFRENGITVNNNRCRINYMLTNGDILKLILEEKTSSSRIVPLFKPISILYEDEDVLVVNKPAGILVHPVGGHYEDTLSNMVSAYYQKQNQDITIRPVGRLDKDTSGAVMFAKNKIAAARFSQKNCNSGFEKEYLAIVSGIPGNPKDEICSPLDRCPGKPLKMQADPNGKSAFTSYKIEKVFSSSSLLRVKIATGRTHQIRVHMASIGHPLLGDRLYGTEESLALKGFSRTALHAACVQFKQPFSGQTIQIEAPLPEDFEAYLFTKSYFKNSFPKQR